MTVKDPVLVDTATLQPGQCFGCGSLTGPLVDTMVDTFDGRVYLCVTNCVSRFAALAGFEQPGSNDAMHEELVEADAKIADLESQLAVQSPLIVALREIQVPLSAEIAESAEKFVRKALA